MEGINNKPKKIKKVVTKEVTDKPFKSTKVEIDQRVSEIQGLILDGYTKTHLVRYGSSKWKVSERQVEDYISMARKVLAETNQATLEDNLALVTSNLWELFRANKASGNITECHKILMSLAKIRGLDQSTINHVIEDKRELSEMSDEQLDQILEEASNAKH